MFKWLKRQPDIDKLFEGYIGNEGIVSHLKLLLKYSQQSKKKKIPNIAFIGPSSSGKTELTRRVAKGLDLPLFSVSQSTLKNEKAFMENLYENAIEYRGSVRVLPCVFFIDEVHSLNRKLQDALLTALEADDRMMELRGVDFNFIDVNFIIATTDPGKLAPAFKNRFTLLNLENYSEQQIVQLLKLRMQSDNSIDRSVNQLDYESLALIARAAKNTPRKAISLLKQIGMGLSVGEVLPTAESVYYKLYQITTCDYLGLSNADREYIEFVYTHETVGLNGLCAGLQVDKETIMNTIEPYLVQMGLVQFSPRGRQLSERGKKLAENYKATFNRKEV